jgi:HK97 family phage major capsid protein
MSVLSKSTLFPKELTSEMFSLVKGKSSLAKLSGSKPIPFNGQTMFTFALDSEVDVVAENGAKSHGGATVAAKNIVPVKIEYGARISNEFMYAAEEAQIEILKNFAEGFAAKVARGIDIMAFHGYNPRSGSASLVIGDNHFDHDVTNLVYFPDSSTDADAAVETAIALVEAAEYDVTGLAIAPALRAALAAQKDSDGRRIFPELAWGSMPGSLNGLTVDVNSTVSANSHLDRAIVGNFRDYFRWGFAKEIPMEIIEFGNPDNSEDGDLKGHNQIYIRAEAFVGWCILVPAAFARISTAKVVLDKTTATVAKNATTSITATTTPASGTVTWESSDESVATVSSGTVTGVAAGECEIIARVAATGAVAKCAVTVTGT